MATPIEFSAQSNLMSALYPIADGVLVVADRNSVPAPHYVPRASHVALAGLGAAGIIAGVAAPSHVDFSQPAFSETVVAQAFAALDPTEQTSLVQLSYDHSTATPTFGYDIPDQPITPPVKAHSKTDLTVSSTSQHAVDAYKFSGDDFDMASYTQAASAPTAAYAAAQDLMREAKQSLLDTAQSAFDWSRQASGSALSHLPAVGIPTEQKFYADSPSIAAPSPRVSSPATSQPKAAVPTSLEMERAGFFSNNTQRYAEQLQAIPKGIKLFDPAAPVAEYSIIDNLSVQTAADSAVAQVTSWVAESPTAQVTEVFKSIFSQETPDVATQPAVVKPSSPTIVKPTDKAGDMLADYVRQQRKKMADYAVSQIGVTESGKSGGLPNHRFMNDMPGAWCMAFADKVAEKGGVPFTGYGLNNGVLTYTVAAITNTKRDKHAALHTDEQAEQGEYQVHQGDIALEWYDSVFASDPVNHAAVVVKFNPKTGRIVLVSGNSGHPGAVRKRVTTVHDPSLRYFIDRFAHPVMPGNPKPAADKPVSTQPTPTQPAVDPIATQTGIFFGNNNDVAAYSEASTAVDSSKTDDISTLALSVTAPPVNAPDTNSNSSSISSLIAAAGSGLQIGTDATNLFSQSSGGDSTLSVTNPEADAPFVIPTTPEADPTKPDPAESKPNKPEPADRFSDGHLTPAMVAKMLPHAGSAEVNAYTPMLIDALEDTGKNNPQMELNAFSTINPETSSFEPLREYGRGGGRYRENGNDYYGRGFIQLTWGYNYKAAGKALGIPLYKHPDLALKPKIAAKILAWYMTEGDHDERIMEALQDGNLANARRVVNGGTNGLDKYTYSYQMGVKLLREQQGLRI